MVCPNCKSTDIVLIQGQNYCINCGQVIPASAAKPAVKAAAKVVAPKPKLVAKPIATTAKPAVKVADKPTKKPAPAVVAATAVSIKPKPAAPPTVPVPKRQMSDIVVNRKPAASGQSKPVKPVRPTVLPIPKTKSEEAKKIETPTAAAPSLSPAPSTSKPLGIWQIAGQAWRAATDSRYLAPLFWSATLILLPLAAWVGFSDQFNHQGWPTELRGLSVVLVAYALGSYLLRLLIDSGVIFSYSKRLDSRSVAKPHTWAAGLASVVPQVVLDVVIMLQLVVIGVLAALVWYLALPRLSSPVTLVVEIIGLAAAYYLVMMITISRQLARPAIILGKFGSFRAFGLGWRLAHRQLAKNIVALTLSLLASVLALTVAYGAAVATSAALQVAGLSDSPIISAAAGLVVGGLALAVAIMYIDATWLNVYREGAKKHFSSQFAKLVSGRGVSKLNGAGLAGLSLVVVVLFATCALGILRPELIIQNAKSVGLNLPTWR